jgi:predicted TPR repeat methyltransferase
MSRKAPDLDAAYALQTPDDSRRLYADWAETYDESFARRTGYRLPEAVAAAFAAAGGSGPVLDLGAGTGLVAERLAARGIGPVDAVDISPQMLARARAKGLYRALVEGDATAGLDLPAAAYAGLVSAGTFTLGHLGPGALPGLLRLLRPGGLAAISVNAQHWAEAGFAPALAVLPLLELRADDVPIYDGGGPHGADRALVVSFRTRG